MTDASPTTSPTQHATGCPPVFTMPQRPLDAGLVADCAEFTANDRERRRLIDTLSVDRHTAAAAAMRSDLVGLTAERHQLIRRIIDTTARTRDGLRTKANVLRVLVADLPALGNIRIELADSLAADTAMVLA